MKIKIREIISKVSEEIVHEVDVDFPLYRMHWIDGERSQTTIYERIDGGIKTEFKITKGWDDKIEHIEVDWDYYDLTLWDTQSHKCDAKTFKKEISEACEYLMRL